MELKVLLHAVDVLEDIVDDARHDAMQLRVRHNTLHGMSFAGGCLPICKDGAVVAIEHI